MSNLSCEDLIAMGRAIPTPFHMTVAGEESREDIRVQRVLRLVPGKRLVCLANWRDSTVIMKLFFAPRHWKRHIGNDIRGIDLLEEHHIPTPGLLHRTTTADQQGGLLLTEFLRQGATLGELFDQAVNDIERQRLGKLVIETIANCHSAGFWQADIHLDNFMVAGDRVYLLDGGDIRKPEAKLRRKTVLKNLALFFAQFPVSTDAAIPLLAEHYSRHGVALSAEERQHLPCLVKAARIERLARYEKKLFRSTTAHNCISKKNRHIVYDRSIESAELNEFIDDPDSFFEETRLLKDGNSSTVAVITIGPREFVAKRYNVKGFRHGLKRALQPSRAHHSWRNAAILAMLGIPTPHPCLYMEQRLYRFRKTAYFLCEKIDGDDVLTRINSPDSALIDADKLVSAFKSLLDVFADYQISHGDMKASNFIFKNDKLFVLDLDAMKRHRFSALFRRAHRRDRVRLMRNWQGKWIESHFQHLGEEVNSPPAG